MGNDEPRHVTWALLPPLRDQSLSLRCLRDGDGFPLSPEWLVERGQKTGKFADGPARVGRFTCAVELSRKEPFTFAVSGHFTFQLTLQYHFAYGSPRLQIGCTGSADSGESESWFEWTVPFGEAVRVHIT